MDVSFTVECQTSFAHLMVSDGVTAKMASVTPAPKPAKLH